MMCSSKACSSAESTSSRVAIRCWASTARHSLWRCRVASEATAIGVQVADNAHQSFRRPQQFGGTAVQRRMLSGEPGLRLRLMAEQGIERAEQPGEQRGMFPDLLLRRVELPAA